MRARGLRWVRTSRATLRIRTKGTRGGKGRVEGVAPERFVVSALVAAFMAHNRQKLKPLGTENSAQRQPLRKRDLGRILRRAAVVEDGSGKMDSNDLGKDRDPHMPGDATLRGRFRRREFHLRRNNFRVSLDGRLNGLDFQFKTLPLCFRA